MEASKGISVRVQGGGGDGSAWGQWDAGMGKVKADF